MLRRIRYSAGSIVSKAKKKETKVAVTGGSSYSGRYITDILLGDDGVSEIRSLTNRKPNHVFGRSNESGKQQAIVDKRGEDKLCSYPLNFEDKNELVRSLTGVDVIIITYWMRFFEIDGVENRALENIKTLVDACKKANVNRIVYVSHTKTITDELIKERTEKDSALLDKISRTPTYIMQKSRAELYIRENCSSFAFIRPCCLFGDSPSESIVVNNTSYIMRRLPLMIFPEDPNTYHFHPVHVRDLAEMCVNLAFRTECGFVDAVGPEKMTLYEYSSILREATGSFCFFPHLTGFLAKILSVPLVYQLTRPVNYLLDDIFIDKGDLEIATQDLACSDGDPSEWGQRSFRKWAMKNGTSLGLKYVNTFKRYYDSTGVSEFASKDSTKYE